MSTPRPGHKGKLLTEALPHPVSQDLGETETYQGRGCARESGSSAESPGGSRTHGARAGAVRVLCQVRGQAWLSPIAYSKEPVRGERPQAGLCPGHPTEDKKDGA